MDVIVLITPSGGALYWSIPCFVAPVVCCLLRILIAILIYPLETLITWHVQGTWNFKMGGIAPAIIFILFYPLLHSNWMRATDAFFCLITTSIACCSRPSNHQCNHSLSRYYICSANYSPYYSSLDISPLKCSSRRTHNKIGYDDQEGDAKQLAGRVPSPGVFRPFPSSSLQCLAF